MVQNGKCLAAILNGDSGTKRKVSAATHLDTFGSMVQNGKFSAATLMLQSKLKNVDLPTFGRPTTPIFTLLPGLPSSTFLTGSSFFGGILNE